MQNRLNSHTDLPDPTAVEAVDNITANPEPWAHWESIMVYISLTIGLMSLLFFSIFHGLMLT